MTITIAMPTNASSPSSVNANPAALMLLQKMKARAMTDEDAAQTQSLGLTPPSQK